MSPPPGSFTYVLGNLCPCAASTAAAGAEGPAAAVRVRVLSKTGLPAHNFIQKQRTTVRVRKALNSADHLVYVNFNFVEGPSVAHMCRASDRRRLTATYLCWSLYTAQVPRGFLCVCRLTGLFVVTTGSWSEWFLFFLLLLLLHLRGPSGSCSWWSRCAQGEQHLEAVRHVIP